MPTPPPYACQVGQVHIMCSCCLQPMPDRRNEYILRPDQARPQQCEFSLGPIRERYIISSRTKKSAFAVIHDDLSVMCLIC